MKDFKEFITKDSGEREEYESGMRRDTQKGKERFDLLVPENIPYEHTMLYRDAMLSTRGAEKYEPRNNEKAKTPEELARFKESAFRHFIKWYCGLTEEDEAAASRWNIRQYEEAKWRKDNND